MFIFAVSIFLSAFLLFQIQPMIGKLILPWFGGTPAVWSTVMLLFHALLTGGYASHWILLSRDADAHRMITDRANSVDLGGYSTDLKPWTDAYSNLFQILK